MPDQRQRLASEFRQLLDDADRKGDIRDVLKSIIDIAPPRLIDSIVLVVKLAAR